MAETKGAAVFGDTDLTAYIDEQITNFRRQLLGLTLRNPLLSCPHGQGIRVQVRIVDELPDAVFAHLDSGDAFEVVPLPEPRSTPDDEDDEEFEQALSNHKASSLTYQQALRQLEQATQGSISLEKLEREARDHVRLLLGRSKWEPEQGLSPDDLGRRHDISPSFELPFSDQGEHAERHHDDALQTLLREHDLNPRLRLLGERARSDLRDRGVSTLFAAFGFLEWYEDDAAQRPHLAPLVLVPVELNRVSRNNRQIYELRATDEEPMRNAALAEDLRRRFGVELPDLTSDDSPESYFEKIKRICDHYQRWHVRRFLTIHIFSDAKLAIYADLNRDAWPDDDALSRHRGIRQLMSETGVTDAPYGTDHDIDGDKAAVRLPALIYDADSSQHSTIVDALRDGNLAIYGPPGTGKSQTITNLIAAAMDAGKTVLFVAEKLTALDVVHKRLHEADLDRYCFVLHSRGIRRGAVREALRQRVDAAPPDFDQATYENLRMDWETQRDALKLYASIMGDRLGALELTVHEILWKEIRRREGSRSLPPDVATIRLPEADALALTVNGLQKTKGRISELVSTHKTLGEPGVWPWRGIMGTDLPPTEVAPTLHRLAAWRTTVGDLAKKAACFSDAIDLITLDSIAQVDRATALLEDNAELGREYDLAALAFKDTRRAVIAANDAATRASEHARTFREKFDLDPACLQADADFRAMVDEASALDCVELAVGELAGVAEAKRARVDSLVQLRLALKSLHRLFSINEPEAGTVQTIVQAIDYIRQTPRPLLLARTDEWVEERAHIRLAKLQASVEKARCERETLEKRFDMKVLPSPAELRAAGCRFELSRMPLWLSWLSAESYRAAKLYRGIARKRRKPDAGTIAVDLLRLAEHEDAVASLLMDEDGKALFGNHWRGLETNLREALEVAGWAETVAKDFSGIGAGRMEVRHMLLHGNTDTLDEVINLASGLRDLRIEDHFTSDGGPIADPNELYERAKRIDDLATRSEQAGLPEGLRLIDANAVADLLDHYRRDRVASEDIQVPRLVGDITTDGEMITSLAELCCAIDAKALTAEAWRAAIKANAEYGSGLPGEWFENIRNAVAKEEDAWCAWTTPLKVNETVFFDGVERKAVPLDALRQRAGECLDGGNTILEWCRYRRILGSIFHSEAKPVLESFEQNQIDVGQLSIAFELTLYRSLASIVFRKYPDLQRLTGAQLRNHKEAYCEVEGKLQKLECARIAYELHHRPVERGISAGPPGTLTERALINYQLDLNRASVSPRELMNRSGKALRQLKPCFMMSPTTVAELLPKESEMFDLVVIDEASQMLPSDALGAIARARRAIIVGDPQQLPPTTFFQGGGTGAEGDDGDGLATASESILDLAMSAWRPHRYLRWHYRSRHSALIQFSNAKFYDNCLIIFPGPNEGASESGVNFHYVDNGIYRGDRTNVLEAERIVEAVIGFAADGDNLERSLAVVTMNQPQRDFLDDFLDKAASEHSSLARYIRRWENTLEPFTVKNLESVQGDERDVIFISTVYGPRTPDSPVLQQFGPITQQGGERRLNVLFTRARWRIDVFSSMRANDIQPRQGSHRGVEVLRDYLEYAATGRIGTGISTGVPTESPFEEHVKEKLVAVGYDVTPQVGVARYRIDLGVKHTEYPHGFLLGIECDGATYHSAKSVRDRDRLREAVLRGLGWDIYRIWSTDWFNDADREIQRLLDYLEGRLAKFREGQGTGESDLDGTVVDGNERMEVTEETLGRPVSDAGRLTDAADRLSEADVIEVGDTVFYRRNVNGEEVRKVVIVSGADDPDRGIINDAKPLARAVLGRYRGETVTVHQRNSRVEVTIERIVKGEPDSVDETMGLRQSDLFPDNNGLHPYRIWRGSTPDPRSAPATNVEDALRKIIETEGPVVTERVYRVYIRASSLRKAGRQVRKSLDKVLKNLEGRKIIAIIGRGSGEGYAGATIRLTDSPIVILRDRGDRDLDEIPVEELAEMYRLTRAKNPDGEEESVHRDLLSRYGLTRMTTGVRDRLNEAAQQR